MPAMIFTSVDLPAPLSPMRPTTSPGATSSSTWSSACTAPKRLVTPRSESKDPFAFISVPSRSAGFAGARRAGRPARPTPRFLLLFLSYCNPAALQSDAKAEVQICDTVQKLSFTMRSEEHTSELQSQFHLVCRLLLEKKKKKNTQCIQSCSGN